MDIITSGVKEIIRLFWLLAEEGHLDMERPEMASKSILSRMGIRAGVDGNDCLINHHDGARYPSWVGSILLKGEMSFDYEIPFHERSPRGECPDEYKEYQYGDPCYGYHAWGPSTPRIPKDIVARLSAEIEAEIPCLIQAWQEKRDAERKEWGRKQNLILKEAGCSAKAIQAWWSLQWKREIGPEQWTKLIKKTPDEAIRIGLAAHSKAALAKLGVQFNRSFPRAKDLLQGLAIAKGLKRASETEYKDWLRTADPMVPKEENDIGRLWTF